MTAVIVVRSGSLEGRELPLDAGGRVCVGRSPDSDLAVTSDQRMSRTHFVLECDGAGCRVRDLGSRNGTFVNGERIGSFDLRDGDEIVAGETRFAVRFPVGRGSSAAVKNDRETAPAAPAVAGREGATAAALTVGHWHFVQPGDGWEPVEGIGLRRSEPTGVQGSIVADEEELESELPLERYVGRQQLILDAVFVNPEVRAFESTAVTGADEAGTLNVRHRGESGQWIVQEQLYVRSAKCVGIVTFTASEHDLPSLRAAFDEIRTRLRWMPS